MLENYTPKIFINYNVLNEEMWKLNLEAIESKRSKQENGNEIIIGYFSGSDSHNNDFNMITPALLKFSKIVKTSNYL